MKVVQINSLLNGSTGKIARGIQGVLKSNGFESIVYAPKSRTNMQYRSQDCQMFGTIVERELSRKLDYYSGKHGSFNLFATYSLLHKLQTEKSDIIHLHNIHSSFINLRLLFGYLKKHPEIKKIWTLHDCWAFTGDCPYFTILNCEEWKTGCEKCQYHGYPKGKRDRSRENFYMKKKWFTGVENMTIVTPSQWLADLVKESYLGKYDVTVINNGIDLSVFRPCDGQFREQHNLQNKFIILSVAFSWGYRKGQDRVERLAEKLDGRFQIVMVGTDKSSVQSERIICISKTDSQQQLAEIYSNADVFLNTTREDNFPTVNIEALSCGLPVLTYGAGGSAEAINDYCGVVVSDKNIIGVLERLYESNFQKEYCIERGNDFDMHKKFKEYLKLYSKIREEDTERGYGDLKDGK